jgi:phosphatidylglycerol:prolipoprotein diacylglycerol transferase
VAFLTAPSGWVWYGGVMGGALAVWLLAQERGTSFLRLADAMAPALALGLAIGRIGCQLAGDGDYGMPTTLPWGMAYPAGTVPTTERVHPAPLYEMIGLLGLFGRYLVGAGILRFVVELVRTNPRWLAGLTTAQWMSTASVALGGILATRPTSSIRSRPRSRTR